MKKGLVSLLLAVITVSVTAQVRHVRGIKSIEGGYGLSIVDGSPSAMYNGSFVMYLSQRFYTKSTIFYETGEVKEKDFTSLGVGLIGNFTLFPPVKERFFVNASGGIVASSDKLSKPVGQYDALGNYSESDYKTMKFGLLGGIESELFINDKWTLIIGWNQRMLLNSNIWGRYRWYAQVAIRYNL